MERRRSISKALWISLGFTCLALGTIGVVLPILPTVPFYLATVFCFTKSSQRLHDWFVGTKLYKRNLEGFMNERAMTMRAKLKVIGSVTVVMGVAFALMARVPVGQLVLAIVWACHVIYFLFRVRTVPAIIPEDDCA